MTAATTRPPAPPVALPSPETLAPIMTSWSPRASQLPGDLRLPPLSLPPQAYGTEFSDFAVEFTVPPPAWSSSTRPPPPSRPALPVPGPRGGMYAIVRPRTRGR
ncbi:MAG: hypothetical protein AAGN82_28200 [Myxococcota bacterium]